MNKNLIFSTNNRHKLQEVNEILGSAWQLSTPKDNGIFEDIPETSPTIEGNAIQKAQYIFDKVALGCFADDTGLEVEALDGAPGVYSARYAGDECNNENNIDLLLENLKGSTNRSARFRTVIALVINGEAKCFEGVVEGVITLERCGEKGFGYDSVFLPNGYDQTFAQMSSDEKNKISHRGRAVAKLVNYLSAL